LRKSVTSIRPGACVIANGSFAAAITACGVTPQAHPRAGSKDTGRMHARSLGQRVRRPGVKGGSGRPRLNIDGVSASCRRSSIRCRVLVMVLLAAAFQPARATAATLPPEVVAALARGKLPTESVSIVVREVASADGGLAWRAGTAANPASLMKLVTTYAALDLLDRR